MSNKITHKLLFFILITLSLIKTAYTACNLINCPPLRGLCESNQCICEESYATINNKYIQSNGISCNYHLKSRFVAFLLEFFFPFGVGHFYAGKTILAAVKLGILVLIISTCCCVLCFVASKKRTNENANDDSNEKSNACSFIVCIIFVLSLIGLVIMEVFDLVCYGLGLYLDGNGVPMN